MQKKQLFYMLAIIIIIAGIIVTIIGVLKYQSDTKLQQPVLEEYSWDNDGTQQKEDIMIESLDENESDNNNNNTESNKKSDEDVVHDDMSSDSESEVNEGE